MPPEPTPTATLPALDLYQIGERHTTDSWLISDWTAGQSTIMQWSDDNVRVAADGAVELVLGRSPAGAARPYQGGEIQGAEVATTGTWGWTVQAPEMEPGAVFGMFTYKADWEHQPWVEFDFEFVGADTTKVQLAIHMEDAAGNHITLNDNGLQKSVIDLGFDAAEGFHTYEVTVTDTAAIFYIDGAVVARFSAADMPGGVWNIGPMKSYVDLWAVAPAQEEWAGRWVDPGEPLIGRIAGADIRSSEYGSNFVAPDPDVGESGPDPVPGFLLLPADAPPDSVIGSSGADRLRGNADDNILRGAGGADTIVGGAGHDRLYGGVGNDVLNSGAGNDIFSGGAGRDALDSRAGKDAIIGGAGNDTLIGETGRDLLSGGAGADIFVFRPGSDRDVILNFQNDIDAILLVDLGISSFDQARAHATQDGVHVVFDFEDGDSVTVRNTTISMLGDDLIFV